MQSHRQPIHSTSSKSPSNHIFRPYKTHLSLEYLLYSGFWGGPKLSDSTIISSFEESLRRRKKLRIPSGINSLAISSNQNYHESYLRYDKRKFVLTLLKEFRNLKSLKISRVPFSYFQAFRKGFRSFRALKNLEISFVGMTSAHDKRHLQNFIKTFSPRLRQLKLSFPEYEDRLLHLEDCRIDRLNNLKQLTLESPISSFLQEKGNLKYIDLSPMKRLNHLQSLDITLNYWMDNEPMQINTKQLYFDPNKLFPNLKKFTWRVLNLSFPKIKGLELIGPQIASKLKYLDDFGIGFRHRVAKVDIQGLSQYLATLKTDLNCFNFISNYGRSYEKRVLLSQLSLPRLKKLHTLSLEFNRCFCLITSRFLADLAQICAKNFTGLRFLRLSFESYEEDSGEGIILCLKQIFSGGRISDIGVENFARILTKGCQDLEIVSLKFINCPEISDLGVKRLCQRLGKLKKLRTIWMSFLDCFDVTGIGCKKAAKLLGGHRQAHVSQGYGPRWR